MIYRRIIPLFILAIVLFSFAERKYKNDLAKENLKGKVKTITERSYLIKRPSPKDSVALMEFKYIRQYNAAGNMTEETTYSGIDSILRERDKYQYDGKGIKLSRETYRDTNLIKRYTYQPDADGNIIGEEQYVRGKLTTRGTYIYDTKGNNTEYKANGVKDSMVMLTQNAYDATGRLTQESTRIQGRQIWLHKYKYNDKGERSETQYIGPNNAALATEKYRYTYDKASNWTQKTTTIRDSVTHITTRGIEYWP